MSNAGEAGLVPTGVMSKLNVPKPPTVVLLTTSVGEIAVLVMSHWYWAPATPTNWKPAVPAQRRGAASASRRLPDLARERAERVAGHRAVLDERVGLALDQVGPARRGVDRNRRPARRHR